MRNKAFLVSNLGLFIFSGKILQVDKLKGTDFKFDKIFKNTSPKMPK